MTDDAVPYHYGFGVSDLDAAMAAHGALGVSRWVVTDWNSVKYFDAAAGGIVEPRYRAAYGRVSETIALEFLVADPAHDQPGTWLLTGPGIGTGHLGHWVRDVRPVAQRLLRDGGRIVLALASTPEIEALTVEAAADPDRLPDWLDTCYVLTAAGQLVELVPAAVWAGRLVDVFGPDTPNVIPRPPAHLVQGS